MSYAVALAGLLATLPAVTNSDYMLTHAVYGNPYPHYPRQTPPTSITLTPSNCSSGASDALYAHSGASGLMWTIQPDCYNVRTSASGSSTSEYTGSGSIISTVNFSGLSNAYVNGGPEVIYGRYICCAQNALDQGITFPIQLSSLYALNVDVAYSLDNRVAPYDEDVMFDEWLMPTSSYVGSQSGTIECAVKMYSNFGQKPSWYVGTITAPLTVNGTKTNVTYDEWYDGEPVGSRSHAQVYFTVGNPSNSSPSGTFSGEVAFNILPFLNACATIVPGVGRSWWVSGMLLSNEYGSGSSDQTPSIDYTWTVTKILYQEVPFTR